MIMFPIKLTAASTAQIVRRPVPKAELILKTKRAKMNQNNEQTPVKLPAATVSVKNFSCQRE